MKMIYFSLGLLAGIIILLIYMKHEKAKRKTKFIDESIIFQLAERSKDILYYFEVKPEYRHKYISPSVEDFLGKGLLEKLEENPNIPFELIHPDDYDILAKKASGGIDYSKGIIQRLQDSEGNYRWFEEYATPIYEKGELIAVHGIMRNIDEKVELQKRLEYRITHDPLTDIYNRDFFEQCMEKYNKYIDAPVAIMVCDLDELKYVNDHHGHKQGDVLIKESARLLHRYFSRNAIVSRIGGDEFAIILINLDRVQVDFLCEKLSEEIREYNTVHRDAKINMSVGYAFNDHSLREMESLFTEADENMYREKRLKKEQYITN
ncbi:MAG: diguanylate cyclase domain-containing protein [Lysinibacillus sp.]